MEGLMEMLVINHFRRHTYDIEYESLWLGQVRNIHGFL